MFSVENSVFSHQTAIMRNIRKEPDHLPNPESNKQILYSTNISSYSSTFSVASYKRRSLECYISTDCYSFYFRISALNPYF